MTESEETPSAGRVVAGTTFLGAVGLIIGLVTGMILYALVGQPLAIPIDAPAGQLLVTVGTYAGLSAVGVLYLVRYDVPVSSLRYRRPGWLDLGVVVVAIAVLLGLALALPALIERVGLPIAEHSVADMIEENPTIALVFLPVSILVIGPAEELLYRGVIQTRLQTVFDTHSAVAVASVVFAVVHFLAYLDPSNVPGTIVTIFLLLLPLGAILGAIYEYTDNLVVPTLAHGFYNAITYAAVYVETVGLF